MSDQPSERAERRGPEHHGVDPVFARRRMIDQQIRRRGINDRAVLEALEAVPRERFVPKEAEHLAYTDRALPIESGQTISQPFMVAIMTQALELTGRERVLEIGTGSGYQAAVLGRLCHEVYSIERHADLAETAAARLRAAGLSNVHVFVGDGTLGYPDKAPFDRILVTAGGPYMPPALFEQLAEGGLLVMPVGTGEGQTLEAVRKVRGRPVVTNLGGCRFVKLVGEQGWAAEN